MKPQLVGLETGGRPLTPKYIASREQQARWYRDNKEKKIAYARAYYARNRASKLAWSKEYRRRRPDVTLASQLRCMYGLSIVDYNAMLTSQGNMCAICQVAFDKSKKATSPSVDHCHSTGRVRGILCSTCNTRLGHVEAPGFLASALKYLEGK